MGSSVAPPVPSRVGRRPGLGAQPHPSHWDWPLTQLIHGNPARTGSKHVQDSLVHAEPPRLTPCSTLLGSLRSTPSGRTVVVLNALGRRRRDSPMAAAFRCSHGDANGTVGH
ncbi:hypothetical protein ACCO45_009621 [Purpureocillium lilacinum]|uniref:Uncharacterized protein n=1 Tax=Purpureocillium lilacinum TaxID=33203 RepID=A0ACC4DK82_PURLI